MERIGAVSTELRRYEHSDLDDESSVERNGDGDSAVVAY